MTQGTLHIISSASVHRREGLKRKCWELTSIGLTGRDIVLDSNFILQKNTDIDQGKYIDTGVVPRGSLLAPYWGC